MKLVVVESPAKAKTINKYLGKGYQVEASFGHVCDLPSKDGSVVPENDFEMKYEISPRAKKTIKNLSDLAKKSDEIILATDPDREGEAISWHVIKVLEEKKALKHNPAISRVAFNEITKKAVQNALQNARQLDEKLIDAQQARRALDYLVGFNISPILWRKLPGSRSAGRVQSVALKLICEREDEIDKFVSQEYWDIHGNFIELSHNFSGKKDFWAKLTVADKEKLEKFSIPNQKTAEKIKSTLESYPNFEVTSVEKKLQKRNPQAPFTTSTMQQEASRKLGFTSKKTMQIAQKLYEGVEIGDSGTTGLITYMRTDGVYMSSDAIDSSRNYISNNYGAQYLPKSARQYKAKSKNAQEAHEAIRPTDFNLSPDNLKNYLDKDLLKLYELIWKRALASQMQSAELEIVSADISSPDNKYVFRASGSTIKFDGFYKLYIEGKDDEKEEDGDSKMLPPLQKGEKFEAAQIDPKQHFTEPPPRYNEASLVKKLEELGIGRPSTYSTIISVIQDRNYVKLEKKRFIPEERGRLVTAFLNEFFGKYVEYDFTANLEEDLDKIAEGSIYWKNLLKDFWEGFSANTNEVSKVKTSEVIENLDRILETHLFPEQKNGGDPRKCPSCKDGRLGLRIGKFGAFIACSNYPDCEYRKGVNNTEDEHTEHGSTPAPNNKILGEIDGKEVFLKKGPYGFYVEQSNDPGAAKKAKPKRASIPSFMKIEEIDLANAKKLLSLPKNIGTAEDGQEMIIGIGKYGPYIKCGNKFTSIPKTEDPFTIEKMKALEIIKEDAKLAKQKRGKKDES